MNKLVSSLAIATLLTGTAGVFAQNALEKDPGYLEIDKVIDLKTIRPEVNVNLPRFLLKDAAASLNGGPEDPFKGTGINFSELIKDIKLIRVVVIDDAKENRAALDQSVKALRAELETKWTPLVAVPDEKESVGVYARSDASGETMAGLAVLIHDGSDAVIANVVGKVSIGKIIQIASKFDKIPKDILKKLGAQTPAPEAEEKPGKTKAEDKEETSAE